MKALCVAVLLVLMLTSARADDVVLVENGVARSAIYVAPSVMAPDVAVGAGATWEQTQAETNRRKLRASVDDLRFYLEKMSGATPTLFARAPDATDKTTPILVGDLAARAARAFGRKAARQSSQQAFRVVVSPRGIGLWGANDEATSYAIYEVLHRLGCRWYLPSEMGEVVPRRATVALPPLDFAGAPGTLYRGVRYGDDDFRRRNRLGGTLIAASHALESYVSKAQREAHPEWCAIIDGQPHPTRLKWSHAGVQQAVADAILARLDEQYVPSISLSPEDGGSFDESDDRAWDAGDYDPVMNGPSITDRYIKFCNIVAQKVTRKYPDVKLGFLAYVQYTQPPIREQLHPNLVPTFAPINYCRAHAMTDNCPSRARLRPIIEGWAKASDSIAYRGYIFNLAEYSAPYPMMHQMKEELPIFYRNKVQYWQPETVSNFESVLPGMVLTLRKAWNPAENSEAILDEFFANFYGEASAPMRRYWRTWDDAWTEVDEHSGSVWSYNRRFTPAVMQAARWWMDVAAMRARDPQVRRRVQMQNEALQQFELFMELRRDLNGGVHLASLGPRSQKWLRTQLELSEKYEKQYAFDKVPWTKLTAAGQWFSSFIAPPYGDATRIARDFEFISPPLRLWKYRQDADKTGEARELSGADFDDAAWKTTDVGVETWATLGMADYFGPVWYRSHVEVPATAAGKKVWLWVSSADGDVALWVNGQPVPWADEQGKAQSEFKGGYGKPISFDISAALKVGALNQITIRGTRVWINELGTGGLLGPVYLYRENL